MDRRSRYLSNLFHDIIPDRSLKMENTCVCLNIIKIEPNFRSLFYYDSIIKTICSREQNTSHIHAHTFIKLKKTMKVTKLWDFDKVLRNIFLASSREFALYFLVSLFSCFDHFMGVFDYSVGRSMLSCYHGVHGLRRRAFSGTKSFFARSIIPNFSMGRTDRSTENLRRP